MQAKDLKPAGAFAVNFGLKCVVYGGPGSGKTPVCATTSPRALLLLCEAGARTLANSDTPTWPAFNVNAIDEFFAWFFSSAEAKNYDTLVIDSVTQMAEICVEHYLGARTKNGNQADGKRAYGQMSRHVMENLNKLYFMPQKHVVLICKQGTDEVNGIQQTRPIMPGRDLNVRIPHLVDNIIHCGVHLNCGVADRSTFMCLGDMTTMARDRSGLLAQYEPANISHIIAKSSGTQVS